MCNSILRPDWWHCTFLSLSHTLSHTRTSLPTTIRLHSTRRFALVDLQLHLLRLYLSTITPSMAEGWLQRTESLQWWAMVRIHFVFYKNWEASSPFTGSNRDFQFCIVTIGLSGSHLVMFIACVSFTTGKPYIIAVHPSEGWTTGGTKVCIVGMNFYEGVEVVFGTLPASSEVILTFFCYFQCHILSLMPMSWSQNYTLILLADYYVLLMFST